MCFMQQGTRQEFKNIKLWTWGTVVKVRKLSRDYVLFYSSTPEPFCSKLGCCTKCWRIKVLFFPLRCYSCFFYCCFSLFLLKYFYSAVEFCVEENQYYCLVLQDERLLERKDPPLDLWVVLPVLSKRLFIFSCLGKETSAVVIKGSLSFGSWQKIKK